MLTNGVPGGDGQPLKGKAVEIHHHLFDALWNIGTRQIDASILMSDNRTTGDATLNTLDEESKETEEVKGSGDQ